MNYILCGFCCYCFKSGSMLRYACVYQPHSAIYGRYIMFIVHGRLAGWLAESFEDLQFYQSPNSIDEIDMYFINFPLT